jgi:hypothetical protein
MDTRQAACASVPRGIHIRGKAMSKTTAIKFGKMNVLHKILHVVKICVFLLTLGFAYPNILLD